MTSLPTLNARASRSAASTSSITTAASLKIYTAKTGTISAKARGPGGAHEMRVYIAYSSYPYEGCSEPEAAFSTREKVEAYCDRKKAGKTVYHVEREYVELEVDEYE